jgi:hypothetical protein
MRTDCNIFIVINGARVKYSVWRLGCVRDSPGFEPRQGKRLSSKTCRPALEPTQPCIQWVSGFFSCVMRTTHLHLLPRLRLSGAPRICLHGMNRGVFTLTILISKRLHWNLIALKRSAKKDIIWYIMYFIVFMKVYYLPAESSCLATSKNERVQFVATNSRHYEELEETVCGLLRGCLYTNMCVGQLG